MSTRQCPSTSGNRKLARHSSMRFRALIWVCFMLLDVLLLLPPEPRTGIPGRNKYCTRYTRAEVVMREVTGKGPGSHAHRGAAAGHGALTCDPSEGHNGRPAYTWVFDIRTEYRLCRNWRQGVAACCFGIRYESGDKASDQGSELIGIRGCQAGAPCGCTGCTRTITHI